MERDSTYDNYTDEELAALSAAADAAVDQRVFYQPSLFSLISPN